MQQGTHEQLIREEGLYRRIAEIQDYLKKEYKNYKLKEFYTVKRLADKLTAYKVIIVDKKTQEEEELWFNLSGKPIEY